jgi:hypothetical protein
MDSNGN